jgi:hypothetical protein
MIRISHIVWVMSVFNLLMFLAFVMNGTVEAQTTSVPCCVDAMADNTFPAAGLCSAGGESSPPCIDARNFTFKGPLCTGTFTGKAIPAFISSYLGTSALGCHLANGTIPVVMRTRMCVGRGEANCMCSVTDTMVAVATKVSSPGGPICP